MCQARVGGRWEIREIYRKSIPNDPGNEYNTRERGQAVRERDKRNKLQEENLEKNVHFAKGVGGSRVDRRLTGVRGLVRQCAR